jgi:hypothetical protein
MSKVIIIASRGHGKTALLINLLEEQMEVTEMSIEDTRERLQSRIDDICIEALPRADFYYPDVDTRIYERPRNQGTTSTHKGFKHRIPHRSTRRHS